MLKALRDIARLDIPINSLSSITVGRICATLRLHPFGMHIRWGLIFSPFLTLWVIGSNPNLINSSWLVILQNCRE